MVQTCTCSGGAHEVLESVLDPDLFRALSDPNRVTLLAHLGEKGGASTVTEASECCPVDISVVSRHLRTMRSAGLVTGEKDGREVHYRVEHAALAERLRLIADALDECCPPNCC